MKITLLTYGTRGDVQPFVALALGLQKAGHIVRLAAPQRFTDFAVEHAIPFVPLPGDPQELSRRINDANGNLAMIKSVADFVFSIAGDVLHAALVACDDAELIVHSYLFTTGAHSLAHAKGIPDVSVQLFPIFAPTRLFPSSAMPNLPPGVLSYFSHWLITQVFWYVGNLGYHRLRPKPPEVSGMRLNWPFDRHQPNPTPLLFAYSPTILPRPADWTASYIHIIGYLFLGTPASYQPPAELTEFMMAGEPPVCITFGSMVNREAARVDQILRAALKQTGQRGIILSGWGGTRSDRWDDSLLYLDAAPHDWLFPRCRTIVHHGGAGTTAAGLRAGVPNIVVSHAGDQFFWGRRIAAIGVGPLPIYVKNLSVENLTAAFDQVEKHAFRANAQILGRRISTEDGIGEAVRLIEGHARGFRPVRPD
jgi:sterol 3beta-glucosyltransferase